MFSMINQQEAFDVPCFPPYHGQWRQVINDHCGSMVSPYQNKGSRPSVYSFFSLFNHDVNYLNGSYLPFLRLATDVQSSVTHHGIT